MRVVDYAWGRPSITSLKAAGAIAVCRYLAYLPNGKCLTRSEADGLRTSGIDIVSNWEQAGSWAEYSQGFTKGKTHAIEAAKQHLACGGPSERPVYFSTDFDPVSLTQRLSAHDHVQVRQLSRLTPDHDQWDALSTVTQAMIAVHIEVNTSPSTGQLSTIADYYRGVASIIGLNRTGAYGGYRTIKYLFDAGVIKWGWQTYAWSGGQWDARAQLRQIKNGVTIGGVDCDLNDSMAADFGQWGAIDDIDPTPIPHVNDTQQEAQVVQFVLNGALNVVRVTDAGQFAFTVWVNKWVSFTIGANIRPQSDVVTAVYTNQQHVFAPMADGTHLAHAWYNDGRWYFESLA